MRFRIAPAIVGLVLALSITGLALAQADDVTPPTEQAAPADAVGTAPIDTSTAGDTVTTPPLVDEPSASPAQTLFLQLVDPADLDVVVPLSMDQLVIHGLTLPAAVVSIDGDLVDIVDLGHFAGAPPLAQAAHHTPVVASVSLGNQTSTTLFVVRGE